MKKNYENYFIYGLLAVVILILVFALFDFSRTLGISGQEAGKKASADNYLPTTKTENTFETIITGSTDQGDVSIELTPYEMNNGQLKVKMAVNTHSVDISPFDFKQIITLEYEGKIVTPASVPNLSGHHSNGELIFNTEKELNKLNAFTIKIKGIPKIEERVFSWQV